MIVHGYAFARKITRRGHQTLCIQRNHSQGQLHERLGKQPRAFGWRRAFQKRLHIGLMGRCAIFEHRGSDWLHGNIQIPPRQLHYIEAQAIKRALAINKFNWLPMILNGYPHGGVARNPTAFCRGKHQGARHIAPYPVRGVSDPAFFKGHQFSPADAAKALIKQQDHVIAVA